MDSQQAVVLQHFVSGRLRLLLWVWLPFGPPTLQLVERRVASEASEEATTTSTSCVLHTSWPHIESMLLLPCCMPQWHFQSCLIRLIKCSILLSSVQYSSVLRPHFLCAPKCCKLLRPSNVALATRLLLLLLLLCGNLANWDAFMRSVIERGYLFGSSPKKRRRWKWKRKWRCRYLKGGVKRNKTDCLKLK